MTDDAAGSHNIIQAVVDDAVVYIISNDTFTLSVDSSIPGFTTIKKGLTLINTNSVGVTSSDFFYWGTSSDSNRLGGTLASDYVKKSDTSFDTLVEFSDFGIAIGDSSDLKLKIIDGNQAVIQNDGGGTNNTLIKFLTNNGAGNLTNSIIINSNGLAAGADSAYDIGTSGVKFRTVYADNFDGLVTKASAIELSSVVYNPSLGAANNSIALRDASGDITANLFKGTATKARYADLAEIYETDQEYPVGTVIAVGGEKECRAASLKDIVIGVISEKPAYLMNSEAEGQAIALKGRVPVRVKGPVSKGQLIFAAEDGVATTIASNGIVGIALEPNNSDEEKLIECVLKV